MGLQKVAFNFMVERGGKLAKSLLCSKPQKIINSIGLKYTPALEKDTVQLSQTVGKHKIPRYLYHITSLGNYQKMLETEFIKPSVYHKQIYMLELDSFSKYWNKADRNNLCDYILNFQNGINSGGVVMLKIPTKYLSRIKIRPRNRMINKNISFNERIAAIQGNIDAKLTPLYKQKKSDLEFIYDENIPMSQIELVGTYDCSNTKISSNNVCKTIFEKIFKGKPEEPFLKAWRE